MRKVIFDPCLQTHFKKFSNFPNTNDDDGILVCFHILQIQFEVGIKTTVINPQNYWKLVTT